MSGASTPRVSSSSFWDRVEKSPSGCWIWKGNVNEQGYGRVRFNGRSMLAHRVAWMLTHGDVPDGHFVCHQCDNPPCVNPEHLFTGTASDNNKDMHAKGRNNQPHGEAVKVAKLSDEKVGRMRRLYKTGLISEPELARAFGVDGSIVHRALSGENWSHVA